MRKRRHALHRRSAGRRPLVASSAVALVLLAGGATATALTPPDNEQATQALARFEADPDTLTEAEEPAEQAPTVQVPTDADWSVSAPDAKAKAKASATPGPREQQAATRSTERADLTEQSAAVEQQAAAAPQETAGSEAPVQSRATAAAAAPAASAPAASAPAANAADGSERGQLTSMLNSYRASHGLRAVTRDAALDQAAQQWAQWMAQNQSLQHSDYVNGAVQRSSGYSTGSEIIVRYRGGQSLPTGEILSFMHNWWRGSAVHNANMLKAQFTRVGTGYYMGPGGPYAVHIFAG